MERLSGTRRIWLKPKQFTHSQTTKKGKITILQKVWHNRLEVMFGFASLASRTQISALYFPTKQATSLHQHSSSISSLPTQRNLCASNPRCLTSKPLNNGSRNQPFSCKHVPQQSVVFPLPLPLLPSTNQLTTPQTRITSKYTISPPASSKASKPRKSKPAKETAELATHAPAPDPPRATLTLKTYDPASGATLKYSTNKAAEVSRLIQILGRLARPMCALPEVKDDVPMLGAGVVGEGEGSGVRTPTVESVPALAGGGKPGQQAQGGGGGKNKGKKGKK